MNRASRIRSIWQVCHTFDSYRGFIPIWNLEMIHLWESVWNWKKLSTISWICHTTWKTQNPKQIPKPKHIVTIQITNNQFFTIYSRNHKRHDSSISILSLQYETKNEQDYFVVPSHISKRESYRSDKTRHYWSLGATWTPRISARPSPARKRKMEGYWELCSNQVSRHAIEDSYNAVDDPSSVCLAHIWLRFPLSEQPFR